ncbi:CHAT domain-containing protein [Egbenema bharatensis]|uniref:CHAT domain-containing protein n=1 Tax=Egbenema bharatensis TaxID=3463334 RepID=UPI003A85AEF4
MDIALLTTFLVPFLPFLMKFGEKASEKAGEKFGEGAWTKAVGIWSKLHPTLEAKDDARIAAEQVAMKPESEARKAVFQEELDTLLKENLDLAKEIARILQEDAFSNKPNHQSHQAIEQMSGGTAVGNVQGSIFNIKNSSITNMAGYGNIYYREASEQPSEPDKNAKDVDQFQSVKTILVVAANPKGTTPLRLGEEVRSLQRGLERSQYRDRFVLTERWAVTAMDMRRALLDCQPQIVHFSGHGVGIEDVGDEPLSTRKLSVVSNSSTEPEGLMFEDETGQPKLVSAEAIASLFGLFSDQVECVVLNACYSEVQARAIAQHIPYVVGMKRAVGDKAAIEFAIGFYDALLAGRSIEFAYKLGCSAIQMAGIPEQLTPVLKQKPS